MALSLSRLLLCYTSRSESFTPFMSRCTPRLHTFLPQVPSLCSTPLAFIPLLHCYHYYNPPCVSFTKILSTKPSHQTTPPFGLQHYLLQHSTFNIATDTEVRHARVVTSRLTRNLLHCTLPFATCNINLAQVTVPPFLNQ